MVSQRTLKSSIHCNGVGVHTNQRVAMTLLPAGPNTGILFRRVDLVGKGRDVKAVHANVIDSRLCTVIGAGPRARIGTIEHLMAAFSGLGVDNAIVEIGADEVPVMDGSAAPFVFLIECAGLVTQAAPRRAIQVLKPVAVADGERRVAIRPAAEFSLDCRIAYDHPMLGEQRVFLRPNAGTFKADLARARTFCLEEDVMQMRAAGLAKGGSLDNAVVIGKDRVLNEGGLRYDNECVRHKALDCLGDLYLAGAPLLGAVESVRAGHALNHRLLTTLFNDRSAWREVTLDRETAEPADLEMSPSRAAIA
ncbi:MAG: UDP-3-O-acyl-N-acetylglucosamine deacetylase [Alphaproteobacteria bacterium]|nr:UDP-3-O-acyl-N-acetylglucosamine deacetylase [Alphaproteobacteria bacterium]